VVHGPLAPCGPRHDSPNTITVLFTVNSDAGFCHPRRIKGQKIMRTEDAAGNLQKGRTPCMV